MKTNENKYDFNVNRRAIIVDLDGTLALFEGMRKWHEFEKVGVDKVRKSVQLIIDHYNDRRGSVIIVTGRPESCRSQTEKWLVDNGIFYTEMYMSTDDSHDTDTKSKIYEKYIQPVYDVEFVIEDRNSVVKMWRDLGLDCFQIELTDY